MSSILKALKKLETEAPEQSEIRFWSQKKYSRKAAPPWTKGGLSFKKQPIVILLSVTILLVTGGLIVFLKDPGKLPTEINSTKQFQSSDRRALSRDTAQEDPSPEKDIKKTEPVPSAGDIPSVPGQKAPKDIPALVEKTVAKPETGPELKEVPRLEPKDQREVQTAEQDKSLERFSSLPVKQSSDSGLELQAIAWSNDPKNRIAVINGRILREGESIERVHVIHIGKNEVGFKDGIHEWRQLFRIK